MKLLIITPSFPFPLNTGGNQAQYHMIDYLRIKMEISLVYLNTKIEYVNELNKRWPDVKFYPYKKTIKERIANKIQHKISDFFLKKQDIELSSCHEINSGLLNFIEKVICQNRIELIQFEFIEFLYFSYAFPNIRKIFVQHEIGYIRNERTIADFKQATSFDYFLGNMLRAEELMALNNCDAVITLTGIDKNILLKDGVQVPIYVSPAIIPVENVKIYEYKFNNKIVFLGGYAHQPNFKGVTWFLEMVWPKIVEVNNQLVFQIIGLWPQELMDKYTSKYTQIKFLGFVPDLGSYLGNAIMVVPILIGSGMRMKIIEAANYGCPFISTSVGVEGLLFKNNQDCIIEDDYVEFATKLLDLTQNISKQNFLRENASHVLSENYSTKALLAKRYEVYEQVLKICSDK